MTVLANRIPSLTPEFRLQDGTPFESGTLTFYLTNSVTLSAPYTTATMSANTANPLTLNEYGQPPTDVFLDPAISYKVVLKNSAGTLIRTFDPVYDPLLQQQAKFQVYNGNPTGLVAGTAGSVGGTPADAIFDTVNLTIWVCTTTGDAASAVWTSTTGQLSGSITITGVITPTAISTNQDNYNPTGLSGAETIRLSVTADIDITGLAGGAAGRLITVENIGTNRLTFRDQSASSTAANRFKFGDDVFLDPSYTVTLLYDAVSAVWRMFSLPFRPAFGDIGYISNHAWSPSVAGNALTIALKTARGSDPTPGDPVKVAFRDPTATTGTFVLRSVTAALSFVLSAGSTLGYAASEANDIAVGFIDNAGTVEIAVCRNGAMFLEDRAISTTAEGGAGAADSGVTLYSTTARATECGIIGWCG